MSSNHLLFTTPQREKYFNKTTPLRGADSPGKKSRNKNITSSDGTPLTYYDTNESTSPSQGTLGDLDLSGLIE